jgi:hypothetical protein
MPITPRSKLLETAEHLHSRRECQLDLSLDPRVPDASGSGTSSCDEKSQGTPVSCNLMRICDRLQCRAKSKSANPACFFLCLEPKATVQECLNGGFRRLSFDELPRQKAARADREGH